MIPEIWIILNPKILPKSIKAKKKLDYAFLGIFFAHIEVFFFLVIIVTLKVFSFFLPHSELKNMGA